MNIVRIGRDRMDFIIDNYLWFGIFGVILLMALIGFLAEKTNFIKADSAPKPEKKKKGKKKEEEAIPVVEANEQAPVVEQTAAPVASAPASTVTEPASPTVKPKETQPESKPVATKSETEVLQVDPVMTETGEDLTQPFGDTPVRPNPVKEEQKTALEEQEDEDIWRF